MKATFAELLTSKKFLAALAAIATAVIPDAHSLFTV